MINLVVRLFLQLLWALALEKKGNAPSLKDLLLFALQNGITCVSGYKSLYTKSLSACMCVCVHVCVSMRKVLNGIGVVRTAIGLGADDSLISSVAQLHSGTPDHWAL